MDDFLMPVLLGLDISSLTMSLVNIASPHGGETALADSVEAALRTVAHLEVTRSGDTVVARTDLGHAERVVVAARLGAAATADAIAYVEMGRLVGPGACDAKGALAVSLKAAAAGGFGRDVTFVYGTGSPRIDVSGFDFALSAEPTNSAVVGGDLDHPAARRLIELAGSSSDASGAPGPASFAASGVPAVAFGPGDPSLAGTRDEFVPTAELTQCEFVLRQWLQVVPDSSPGSR